MLAVAKATVGAFLLLLPFAWAISPTLPLDTIVNALFLHVGTGNDLWTLPLSWGGMSIWPLLTPLFAPVSGVDRLLYPATMPVLGSLGPYQIGTAALALFLAGLTLVLVRRRAAIRQRDYALILAVGAMALFMLPTSVPSYHFILALGLVMLTRRSLPHWAYVMSVTILTATTFLSMYTMGAYWLSVHPVWDVGVYDPASPLTQLAVNLVLNDAFITALTGANALVFLVLCRYTLWPVALKQPVAAFEQLPAEPVSDAPEWRKWEPATPATVSTARSAPK